MLLAAVPSIAETAVPVQAPAVLPKAETVVYGQSDTILRMGQTLDRRNMYPVYEYLRLSATKSELDGSSTSLYIGGWGRGDFAEKTAGDRSTDADLQYGYISHHGAQNNFILNAGRQFVAEGVASQRLDGIYTRNNFAAGFAAAAYIGSAVNTEANSKGDDLVFGGRVTHTVNDLYTIGASSLKSFSESTRYREEEGLDLWLHPVKYFNVVGRSSYNSMTDGWMEHDYILAVTPMENTRFSLELSNLNYRDYFYKTTTNVFGLFNPLTNPTGLIDPNEKLLALGGDVSYSLNDKLTLIGDFKNFNYSVAKTAQYYGGKVTYSAPEQISAGASIHRMDGRIDKLSYMEYRVFASKKISDLTLALDCINVNYDRSINSVSNAFTVVGAVSYEINHRLALGADIDYSKNPDFDNEVRGLLKLTYSFNTKYAAEGGAKREK